MHTVDIEALTAGQESQVVDTNGQPSEEQSTARKKTETYVIDRQVDMYKRATNERDKEYWFNVILRVLNNHIRSIKMYLLGYDDPTVSQEVQQYMLSNMMQTTRQKNKDLFLLVLQTNVRNAGYTVEDVEQLIYAEIVALLNQYRHKKLSFLQYVTFILPRRIQQKFWSLSKDQLTQVYTKTDYTDEMRYLDTLLCHDEGQQSRETVIDVDELARYEHELFGQVNYQFVFNHRARARKEVDLGANNEG